LEDCAKGPQGRGTPLSESKNYANLPAWGRELDAISTEQERHHSRLAWRYLI
jgi:hypothetical protein